MRRVSLLLLLMVVGCAPRVSINTIPPNELPNDIYASPTGVPSQQARPATLFFIDQGNLVSIERQVQLGSNQLDRAMRALLAGPTPDEQASGLGTAIPDDVELLSVSSSQGLATLNLSAEFESAAESALVVQRIAQVVYTATAVQGISRVRFLVEGEPVQVLAGDGTLRSAPVSRADYTQNR